MKGRLYGNKIGSKGRFKRNNNEWRVYISTLLPNKDKEGNNITPTYSPNDYRKDIDA